MPEGDTIFRAARTLHRALAGHTVVRFESMLPALTRIHEDDPVTGRVVDQVRSAGKHLLMHFSGGLVLRTHMRMNGSWHIYRVGEKWRRSRRDMRVVVATADFEAVGFNLPVAEFIRERDLARHRSLAGLGPDLLSDAFDMEEAVARVHARETTTIGDVLLNQTVVAGVGNVYKSETLFACGVNPFAAARSLEADVVRRVLETARTFLRMNVSTGLPAMTTYGGLRGTTRRDDPRQRLWVYGRAGQPCRRCGTPIRMQKQGLDARLTYWCPTCQKE